MERPYTALIITFCIAQLISSIIAGFGDWVFTQIKAVSGGWIEIVWVWVCICFFGEYISLVSVDLLSLFFFF